MPVYKAPGSPCDLWGEHYDINVTSFGTKAANEFAQMSGFYQISPARVTAGQSQAADTTTYSSPPIDGESWYIRLQGSLSPAKVTAGSTGTTRQGQLT